MVHALSLGLFQKSIPVTDFPKRPELQGKGMSDWDGYAVPLAEKVSYENTYYHKEPFLDITKVHERDWNTLDFLISTDVFEHVAPPVYEAFKNAYRLLKPGGVFVFSVPYSRAGNTVEHFPELFDYRIEEVSVGQYILHNLTRDGRNQVFEKLVFHGGPGTTLEMRVFTFPDILKHLDEAGFSSVQVLDQDELRFGIHWPQLWSLPIIAIK